MKDLQEQIPQATLNVLKTIDDPSRLLTIVSAERTPRTSMNDRVELYRRKFREKYPSLPQDQERYILDVLFGPFNLDEVRFPAQESGDGLASKEQKTHSAKIQHMMTHMVLFGGGANSGEEVRTKVIRQLAQYEAISNSRFGKEVSLGRFLGGVRAEIGVAKALLAGQYEVILPNYQPNSDEKSYEDSQVCKWDVEQGVDLVAVKGADIFLIDAKGTRYFENPATRKAYVGKDGAPIIRDKVELSEKQYYEWDTARLVQTDGLDEIFAQHPQGKVHRMTIRIPTAPEYLSPLSISPQRSSQLTLRGYSRLSNDLITDIIMGLDKSRLSGLGKALSNEGGYEHKVA